MIDFATLQGLTIPEGVVTQIADASGRVLWMAWRTSGNVILEVEKITADTYAGETSYTGEQFILLDIYPKTNGTVNVTYGGLTKTITDTSGAAEPNAQQVFFGTFNGKSDSVETPASGELIIEGDYYAFACGTFEEAKYDSSANHCSCVLKVKDFGTPKMVADQAFYECTGLVSVTIPASITSIGTGAFIRCTGLTSVTIPASVTSIESSVFSGCAALTSVTIPASVTGIPPYAFNGCAALTSVTIPASITQIDLYAFQRCTSLTSVTIPANAYVTGSAFAGCAKLKEFVVDSENQNYTQENGILFNKSKTMLWAYPTAADLVVIPEHVTHIGENAFDDCASLTSVIIPASVTNIGQYAFRACTSLQSVNIPDGVTTVETATFIGCKALTSVTIPASVTSIGASAFNGCAALTSVTIPASVTSIGNYAFSGCTSMTSVVFENPTGWYVTKTEGGDASTGTAVDLSNAESNVTLITNTYSAYYWYRS